MAIVRPYSGIWHHLLLARFSSRHTLVSIRTPKDPALRVHFSRSPFERYGAAIAASLLAVALRSLLALVVGAPFPFVEDYPAVMFAAWYGGQGPGLLATALCAVVTALWGAPSGVSLALTHTSDQVALALFVVSGALISGLNQQLHEKRSRAESIAELWRQQQERLYQSEARKTALLDASLDAIIGIDEEGLVREWNATAEQVFQYRRKDALGRPLDELIVPERHIERSRRAVASCLTDDHSPILGRRHELTARRADGSELPVELALMRSQVDGAPFLDAFIRDVTDRKAAEEALRDTQAVFTDFMDHSPAIAFVRDSEGKIVYVNAAYERFFRTTLAELKGSALTEVVPADTAERLRSQYQRVLAESRALEFEEAIPDPDGKPHRCMFYLFPMEGTGGRRSLGGMVVDVSEHRLLESQLRQAQKMEAVGQLAGGVAHDFNNVLAVINGYSELLLDRSQLDDGARAHISEIQKAGERAASLTRQLLAFSRQQVLAPRILDFNAVIQDMGGMLRRLIGEDIQVVTVLGPALGKVLADPGSVEQVLLNLVVNARDAMPGGGKLTIETRNTTLDAEYCHQHAGVEPGEYVMLAVSDNGCGMRREVQERIFEPFFTTKETGKGTGLGLSTVFGIVRQSGGHVWVYSELGLGTTFRLYFPRKDDGRAQPAQAAVKEDGLRGTETVLVAEDDAQVRAIVHAILDDRGYRVIVAETGTQALQICEVHSGPIDLLITDVVMPGMSGRELSGEIQKRRPGMPILFMSGYTDDAVVRHGVLAADVAFIQKPFSPSALARKVREVLLSIPDLP